MTERENLIEVLVYTRSSCHWRFSEAMREARAEHVIDRPFWLSDAAYWKDRGQRVERAHLFYTGGDMHPVSWSIE